MSICLTDMQLELLKSGEYETVIEDIIGQAESNPSDLFNDDIMQVVEEFLKAEGFDFDDTTLSRLRARLQDLVLSVRLE